MAKAPPKRRGITLGPRAENGTSLDVLAAQSTPSPASDQAPSRAEAAAAGVSGAEQIDRLRAMSEDLDARWQRQAELVREQSRQLEQQRDRIALQARRLETLEQTRQRSGRLGVLLALLALAAVGALGFHTWPPLQETVADLDRMRAGLSRLAPEVQTVRGQLSGVTSDLGQMGGSVASLRQDVTGVRSDLGSLRQAVDAMPKDRGVVQASAGGMPNAARAVPRTATTMIGPYPGMPPMRPW